MDYNDYMKRGYAFSLEKKFGPALENFEAALKLQPDNADLRQFIEMTKMHADEVSKIAQKEAQAYANEAKSWAKVLGITDLADIDKAIAECIQEHKLNPNDASAKTTLGNVYYIRGLMFMSKGEYARALEDYSEAIKNVPNYFFAFNKRGIVNLELGNYDKAVEDFKKAIQLNQDPNRIQPKQNLAIAYKQRGIAYYMKDDYVRAADDYKMALELDPDDSNARELLEMVKAEIAEKTAEKEKIQLAEEKAREEERQRKIQEEKAREEEQRKIKAEKEKIQLTEEKAREAAEVDMLRQLRGMGKKQ